MLSFEESGLGEMDFRSTVSSLWWVCVLADGRKVVAACRYCFVLSWQEISPVNWCW